MYGDFMKLLINDELNQVTCDNGAFYVFFLHKLDPCHAYGLQLKS